MLTEDHGSNVILEAYTHLFSFATLQITLLYKHNKKESCRFLPFSQELQPSDGIPLEEFQFRPHWSFSVPQLLDNKYEHLEGTENQYIQKNLK